MGLIRSFFFLFSVAFSILLPILGCSRSETARPVPGIGGGYSRNEFKRDSSRWLKPKPERVVQYDVGSYALRGRLNWDAQMMRAEVAITVRWTRDDLNEIDLDSQVAKVLAVSESGTRPLEFSVDEPKGILKVELGHLSPGARRAKEATIHVAYEARANVDHEREPSPLQMVRDRAGDVVRGRVAYTSSEPRGVEQWMPCHNVPSDRAAFSAEFLMDESDRFIANGDLVANDVRGRTRRMKYATRYTIPTYLMAFALGDLVSHTEWHGALPVSVWARRGVIVDYHGMVQETIREIAQYEKLLTPYPFEKYAVVMLPEFFAGGIEHAGISFVGENRTNEPRLDNDRELAAHELGHQWFGDYMTIETWDDLWVKEGMATLLAEESRRPWEDRGGKGRLFGRTFYVEDGMSMRDATLAPEDKYTSGPYGRSAWFLTQLRAVMGEDAFWSTLRKILRAHAYGVISGDNFIDGFRGAVSTELLERMREAVKAKKMPTLDLEGDKLLLGDPDHALLAPVVVEWYAADGLHTLTLEPGKAATVPVKDVLFVVDPTDSQAWPSFVIDDDFKKTILPLQVPRDAKARAQLISSGVGAQQAALHVIAGWTIKPEDFARFYEELGSEKAKLRALQIACDRGTKEKADRERWSTTLSRLFERPPYLALSERAPHEALGPCREVLSEKHFAKELAQQLGKIAETPAKPEMSFAHLAWLSAFSTDAAGAFATWSRLATEGPSIRARHLGYTHLLKHLKALPGYEAPAGEELVKWKAFLRKTLDHSGVGELLVVTMDALAAAKDPEALGRLAEIIRAPAQTAIARDALCTAETITIGKPEMWKGFVKMLGPVEELPRKLRALLEAPTKCEESHPDLGDDD